MKVLVAVENKGIVHSNSNVVMQPNSKVNIVTIH